MTAAVAVCAWVTVGALVAGTGLAPALANSTGVTVSAAVRCLPRWRAAREHGGDGERAVRNLPRVLAALNDGVTVRAAVRYLPRVRAADSDGVTVSAPVRYLPRAAAENDGVTSAPCAVRRPRSA